MRDQILKEIGKTLIAFDAKGTTADEKAALRYKATIFLEDLLDLDSKEVLEAIIEARRTSKFCPRASDIREIIKNKTSIDHEAKALLEWDKVYTKSFLSANKLGYEDPITESIARRNLEYWYNATNDQMDWIKKSFLKEYATTANSPMAINELKACEDRRRLAQEPSSIDLGAINKYSRDRG
jgi:hypothetical protein